MNIERIIKQKYVYHYTSYDTLFSLLKGFCDRKSDGCIYFRASCIYNQNDPKEMEYGYDAIKEYLPSYEEKENIPISDRLSQVYENPDFEIMCKNDYHQKMLDDYIEIGTIPYTISMTAKRDYLPMWSMYGKNGDGVCIKFEIEKMEKILNSFWGFVSYGKKELNKNMEVFFPSIYEILTKDSYMAENSELINDKISKLSLINITISPFLKHKDYKYEKEFRFVYHIDYLPEIKVERFYRPRLFKISPYVEIPIPVDALKEIIIGPCANYNVLEPIINRELVHCGINVRVSKSKVPYRK